MECWFEFRLLLLSGEVMVASVASVVRLAAWRLVLNGAGGRLLFWLMEASLAAGRTGWPRGTGNGRAIIALFDFDGAPSSPGAVSFGATPTAPASAELLIAAESVNMKQPAFCKDWRTGHETPAPLMVQAPAASES